jgi:hypothetical protein
MFITWSVLPVSSAITGERVCVKIKVSFNIQTTFVNPNGLNNRK